jgi:hypothetical protein
MNNKIRVDPRTFKIQKSNENQSLTQTSTKASTTASDSDSESSISTVTSDNESIKVIKLNPSQENSAEEKKLKTTPVIIKPKESESSNSVMSSFNQPNSEQLNGVQQSNISNYLKKEDSFNKADEVESTIESTIGNDDISSEENLQEKEPIIEQKKSENTQEVIDLTQNNLYLVLKLLFEDDTGNNVCEKIDKISNLFENHNKTMEKILNQLIIMNSNTSKVKIPDSFQTNTKKAENISDFRENIQKKL